MESVVPKLLTSGPFQSIKLEHVTELFFSEVIETTARICNDSVFTILFLVQQCTKSIYRCLEWTKNSRLQSAYTRLWGWLVDSP